MYNGTRSPQTVANRAWMKREYRVVWTTPHPGYTVDEFPYASTSAGGAWGPALVHYAPTSPIRENSIQGFMLVAFLYGAQMKWKAGWFLNVPVPI